MHKVERWQAAAVVLQDVIGTVVPQTSPSPLPAQNCCWARKEMGERSFHSCHDRGGRGGLKCLCIGAVCHYSKGPAEPAACAGIQQNSSWLKCLGMPQWNSFTIRIENCPFLFCPVFPNPLLQIHWKLHCPARPLELISLWLMINCFPQPVCSFSNQCLEITAFY